MLKLRALGMTNSYPQIKEAQMSLTAIAVCTLGIPCSVEPEPGLCWDAVQRELTKLFPLKL